MLHQRVDIWMNMKIFHFPYIQYLPEIGTTEKENQREKACLEVKVKELFLRLYLHEVQLLLIEEREYVVVGRKGADQVKPSALKRKDDHWANCLLQTIDWVDSISRREDALAARLLVASPSPDMTKKGRFLAATSE